MGSAAGSIWFQGDWSDPWCEGLALVMPRAAVVHRLETSSPWPRKSEPPGLLILHRARLIPGEVERFASWRKASIWSAFPPSILCYASFARYAELERWLTLVDAAIPEATAADTLPRRVEQILGLSTDQGQPVRDESARVLVVSTNPDLRRTLADHCAEWVSRVSVVPELRSDPKLPPEKGPSRWKPGPTVVVIDVPLLEDGWESQIVNASRLGPVIALLGFPDRSVVEAVRNLGADVCLELPFDRDDLGYAIQRCLAGASAARPAVLAGFEAGHRLPRAPTKIQGASLRRPSRHET